MLIFKPATGARFEDVRTILGPKREGAQGCWCLSVRLGLEEDAELRGEARAEAVAKLCRRRAHAPGVLAYDDGEVVGWAGISPVVEVHEYGSKRYPEADDPERTWVLWCFRVRAGHGRQGIATALVEAATDYARSKGAGPGGRLSARQRRRKGRPDPRLRRHPAHVRAGRIHHRRTPGRQP